MCDDVDNGTNDDSPTCGFVEGDVLVKRNDFIQGGAANEGDEVAADGEEDEGDVDMETEGSGTSDSCTRKRPGW